MTRIAGNKGVAKSVQRSPSQAASKANGSKPETSKPKRNDNYASYGVQDNDILILPVTDFKIMLGLTTLSAIVRLFRIYQPDSVVFDEVHFGGFASKYIKGKFFMDVHPPLAKLVITLFGYLAGFDGEFDFKDIGKDYTVPGVPYVAMRMFPAICGILLAPSMFLTLKATGCRTTTAVMGSCLIIFENGLLTQARLILLDSPLMIATAFTALSFTCFTNQQELGPSRAFDAAWWFWLVATGIGLGLTCSIKWVGLFTIGWVGSLTLVQLWVMLGDYKHVTLHLLANHFLARVLCLIVIPIFIYFGIFAIHFLCLVNPGEGDGFMSSQFQATLNSKGMQDTPVDILMGSRVTIRHVNTQGVYLHSHPLMYPSGSKQQQVTLYPHKDENNVWLIENQTQPLDANGQPINGTYAWDNLPDLNFVKDGDVIRLYHVSTHRRLHSHDVRPPITEADWQNEVSAYGYEGFEGDANDFFRVEIVKASSKAGVARERLRAIDIQFKLVHIMTGCVLFSHKVKLPEWASEQQEVTCAKGGTLPNSLWYIESNEHPMLDEKAEKVNYPNPGFFGKFWELHTVMWKTNAGLVESHSWDSRPPSWPILSRGINFWGMNHTQVYLIGNPLIWWSATASVLAYVLFKAIVVLRWQRDYNDYTNPTLKRFDFEVGSSVLGWAFHYFPFFLMQRQLFLHHYFPALYFAILALCQTFDFLTARISGFGLREHPIINKAGAFTFVTLSLVVFVIFSPLAYGNPWTKVHCKKMKLLSTWDFDCDTFLDTYGSYSKLQPTRMSDEMPTPQPPVDVAAEPPPFEAQIQEQEAPVEDEAQKPLGGVPAAGVSSKPDPPLPPGYVLSKEQKVVYRDQHGNVLNEEQVKALDGRAEFKTRYETKTRVIDSDGREIPAPKDGWSQGQLLADEAQAKIGVAPPHPDVQGVDSSTVKHERMDEDAYFDKEQLAHAKKSVAGVKEAEGKVAKPANEGLDATSSPA